MLMQRPNSRIRRYLLRTPTTIIHNHISFVQKKNTLPSRAAASRFFHVCGEEETAAAGGMELLVVVGGGIPDRVCGVRAVVVAGS